MGLLRDYTGNPINFLLPPIDWPPWPLGPGQRLRPIGSDKTNKNKG